MDAKLVEPSSEVLSSGRGYGCVKGGEFDIREIRKDVGSYNLEELEAAGDEGSDVLCVEL
jgi:hypothetical protein